MPKKKIQELKSIWIRPDYGEHFSSEEFRCVELWSYGLKKINKPLYARFQKDLGRLSETDDLKLKIATTGLNQYSYSHVRIGKKEFRVVALSSISGSVVVGHSTVKEFKNALSEVNDVLSKLTYKNFKHKENEKGIVENEFAELEGGYGDYEIADITSDQSITFKEKQFIENSDYFSISDTLGVTFYSVDELYVYATTESLEKAGIFF